MAERTRMFTSIRIGNVEVKNRLALAPMGAFGLVDRYGCYNQRAIDYYVERAKGGTGLLISSVTKVENTVDSMIDGFLPCTDIDPARFVLTASEMTERVHAYGSKMFLQLSMGFGRVLAPALAKKPPVSASAVPNFWDPSVTCRAMTIKEIEFVIRKFGEAAAIAKRAGFDGVEIHAVHEGYLLDQFTTAFTNHRTDKFGGDLRGRTTLPVAIVKEVKGTVGKDFPVVLRFSIKSCVKGFNSGGLEVRTTRSSGATPTRATPSLPGSRRRVMTPSTPTRAPTMPGTLPIPPSTSGMACISTIRRGSRRSSPPRSSLRARTTSPSSRRARSRSGRPT